jgi:hypothetical protein
MHSTSNLPPRVGESQASLHIHAKQILTVLDKPCDLPSMVMQFGSHFQVFFLTPFGQHRPEALKTFFMTFISNPIWVVVVTFELLTQTLTGKLIFYQ